MQALISSVHVMSRNFGVLGGLLDSLLGHKRVKDSSFIILNINNQPCALNSQGALAKW